MAGLIRSRRKAREAEKPAAAPMVTAKQENKLAGFKIRKLQPGNEPGQWNFTPTHVDAPFGFLYSKAYYGSDFTYKVNPGGKITNYSWHAMSIQVEDAPDLDTATAKAKIALLKRRDVLLESIKAHQAEQAHEALLQEFKSKAGNGPIDIEL